MSHCRIPRFRKDEFCGLRHLRKLDLSNNRFYSSEDIGVMCNPDDSTCDHCLPVLGLLDISFNSFSDLDIDFAVGLPHLTDLIVVSSNVSQLVSSFNESHPTSCPLSNLQYIQLKDNMLLFIPEILFKCTSKLKSLDISGNRLVQNGLKIAKPLPFLKVLNLSRNKLDDFPNLHGWRLEQLDLSRNNIVSIPGPAFPWDVTILTNLSLAYNKITSVNLKILCNSTNLRELDLRANGVSTFVPIEGLCKPKPLTTIFLDDNKLSISALKIIQDWSWTAQLQDLHLSNNQLLFFRGFSFGYLDNVKLLDLSGNNISNLFDTAEGHFQTVNVRFNKLQTINKRQLHLRYLKEDNVRPDIYLEGNPLRCTCDVEWLVDIDLNR